jgi:hypothetical protein
MIIKSKGHQKKSGIFRFLINYVFSDKGKANEENSFSFFHNVLSRDVNSISQEFLENDNFRKQRSNGLALHHIIISFSPEDSEHISVDVLHDLIQKFIQLRGNEGLYFGRLHSSEEHQHVHLIMSANKYLSGQSMRVSKDEFQRIHQELEVYQREKYPEISRSIVKLDFDRDIEFPIWNIKR